MVRLVLSGVGVELLKVLTVGCANAVGSTNALDEGVDVAGRL